MAPRFLNNIMDRTQKRDPKRGFLNMPQMPLNVRQAPNFLDVYGLGFGKKPPKEDKIEIAGRKLRERPGTLVSGWGMTLQEFQSLGLTDQERNKLVKPGERLETSKDRIYITGEAKGPYESFEKGLLETVNRPVINAGGVELSVPDIVGVSLLGFGIGVAGQQGFKALMNNSVSRNLNSWLKGNPELAKNLDADVRKGISNIIFNQMWKNQKGWLTKNFVKTIFKPTKGGGILTENAGKAADDVVTAVIKQVEPQLTKFTQTNTGVPGQTRSMADIIGGITSKISPSVQAVQGVSGELKEPWQMTGIEYNLSEQGFPDSFIKLHNHIVRLEPYKATKQEINDFLTKLKPFSTINPKGMYLYSQAARAFNEGSNPEGTSLADQVLMNYHFETVGSNKYMDNSVYEEHAYQVEKALREGKPVPESVLKDYQELQKGQPPVAAAELGEAGIQKSIKETDKFYVYSTDQETGKDIFREVHAKPVKIPGYEEFDFFIHRPLAEKGQADSGWVITEGITGFKVVERAEGTQKAAINQVLANFERAGGKNKIKELLAKVENISPRYESQPVQKPPEAPPEALAAPTEGITGLKGNIPPETPVEPPAQPPSNIPPIEPPKPPDLALNAPEARPEPSRSELNRIVEQSRVVVKRDRPGLITKVLDKIPGFKQVLEFERPGLQMQGDKEDILVAYVAESAARNDVTARAAGTANKAVNELKQSFGKKVLTGEKTTIKFIGTPEQAKNPITGTLKDIADNPELYELSDAQRTALTNLNNRNTELLDHVTDGYGAEIGHFPAKENGAFLPNVDIAEDVIEAVGGEMRAVASGRQKTRYYPSARERMAHDKSFKPETNVIKLIDGMDRSKARAAAGQTFREVLNGKTRLEVMEETHPALYKKMIALRKRLESLRGSAGRLDAKLDKAIAEFMNSSTEVEDLTQLQTSLDVKLQTGPRKGMGQESIQQEIDKVRAQIKALKPAWEVANLKPYQFVQEGIYRYFPAEKAKLIKQLLEVSNNPLLQFIENVRGTAFSGDLSPIIGVQTPVGILADPIGAFKQAGGGIAKAIKRGDPLVSFKESELAREIEENPDDWAQFFSLIGRAPSGTPQEFAGGFLAKIPGFSKFTESTFLIVTRQAKNMYDKLWKMEVKHGMSELDAKVAASTVVNRVFPMMNPQKMGQSGAKAGLIRAMPTSYSFMRKPAEMMMDAAKGFAKAGTFQKVTAEEYLAMKMLITMAVTALVVSALSQALDAHNHDEDVDDAILKAINPDPKNGRFLSIKYGNVRIPIGGPYRGLFRAIYPQPLPGGKTPIPFGGLVNYLKNRINPFMRTQIDLFRNEDYYGQKIRKGDVAEQILRVLAYEIEGVLPLTAGSAIEAWRTGMPAEETRTQVIGQFAGVNVIESKWYEVQSLRDKYSKEDYQVDYTELNQAQKDEILRKHADLKAIYDEAKKEFNLRGPDMPKIYAELADQAVILRNTRLEKAAQALLDGKATRQDYDSERGFTRPYYSGQRQALWQFREQFDPEQAKQLDQYYEESAKPEDKALSAYWDYYSQLVETSDLPKDWDAINNSLDTFLNRYPQNIQSYIKQNKDDWIKDLPPASRKVEEMRAKGLEDETWWDNYRGNETQQKTYNPPTAPPKLYINPRNTPSGVAPNLLPERLRR